MTLLWILLIPFIGGLLCWQTERFGEYFVRWVALLSMSACLLLSGAIWWSGDFSLATQTGVSAWAAKLQLPWIPRFGISLHLAVDGLSLLMVMLTCFIGVLAILCSWKEIVQRIGFFHLNLLWILGGVLGVFMALDLFLFFFFWEMMLVPMYFLIALWGHSVTDGKSRINAATKFFIYTQVSGLIMLVAILGLVLTHHAATGVFTFDYQDLLNTPMSKGESVESKTTPKSRTVSGLVKMEFDKLYGYINKLDLREKDIT